jgi:hypothetical protein
LDDPRLKCCDLIVFVGERVQDVTPADLDVALASVLNRARRILGEMKSEKRAETAGAARSSEAA